MSTYKSFVMLGMLGVLAGCADKEVILEGERLPIRPTVTASAADPSSLSEQGIGNAALPFSMPATVNTTSWTHTAGGPEHSAVHAALAAAPQLVWTASVGQGNSRRHRLTADPVVADSRIFTLDSRSKVTATSTAGATLWSRDLTPPEERQDDASGGGVAFADGKVFATTGFGQVIAMDAVSGAELWRQSLDAPATASPTVLDGLVYVISRDNRAWAIDAKDGRVQWELPGTPTPSGFVGGASPAVTDRVAIFPFGSGEVVATLRQGGVRLWGSAVSGKRQGRSYANITDITADPVVAGDVIYTANQSGRAVALALNSGERLWTSREGASGPVTVADNSVFMISDQAELIRLDAATGERVWGKELSYFKRPRAKRSKAIFAHFGPVLAGGNLWVASDDGTLMSYDPATGNERQTIDLPGGAASSMAVAGNTMYVVSARGQLHAFR
jgi:outer membrane protein assembly factor BamB